MLWVLFACHLPDSVILSLLWKRQVTLVNGWIITLLIAVGLIVILLAVILFSYIECKIIVHVSGTHPRIWVGIRACYGLIRFKYEVKKVDLETIKQTKRFGDDKNDMGKFAKVFISLLSQTHVIMYQWDMELGLGEAPQTAIASGLAWSLLSVVTGVATQYITFDVIPSIQVIPKYNDLSFLTRLVCISRLRVVHSIGAVYMLIYRILRAKGGVKPWRNIQSKA